MDLWKESTLSQFLPSFVDTPAGAVTSDETRRIYDCETCKMYGPNNYPI